MRTAKKIEKNFFASSQKNEFWNVDDSTKKEDEKSDKKLFFYM